MSNRPNAEILKAPSTLLDSIDRQRVFILRMHAERRPCPNCGTGVSVFDAKRTTIDAYDAVRGEGPNGGTCPKCNRGLMHIVPMTAGGWHWFLIPIDLAETVDAGDA